MPRDPRLITIVMADDDRDDCEMARAALAKAKVANPLRTVSDGEELLDYLRHQADYSEEGSSPVPGLILLDLNMPRMNGRDALRELKKDPKLRKIPVVILTTSEADEDILSAYDLGAAGFVTKPISFEGLVNVMQSIGLYWFQIVQHPTDDGTGG